MTGDRSVHDETAMMLPLHGAPRIWYAIDVNTGQAYSAAHGLSSHGHDYRIKFGKSAVSSSQHPVCALAMAAKTVLCSNVWTDVNMAAHVNRAVSPVSRKNCASNHAPLSCCTRTNSASTKNMLQFMHTPSPSPYIPKSTSFQQTGLPIHALVYNNDWLGTMLNTMLAY